MTAQDSPILVAPRPVRLAGLPQFSQRSANAGRTLAVRVLSPKPPAEGLDRLQLSGEDQPAHASSDWSPIHSSVSPSEVMEEFLSILKPTMWYPSTGLLDRCARSLSALSVERSFGRSPRLIKPVAQFDATKEESLREFLPSPVSRNQTRNPFQRHASYTSGDGQEAWHTSSVATPPLLSPRNVPLPSPTPDEMHMEEL